MQRLGLLLRFAVTGALLYWVLSRVQLNRLGPIILDISPLTLAVALGLYFIGVILIGSARWSLLRASQGVSAPFAQLVQSYLVATFFNNVLPTNIGGDVFRIQDGARYTASRTLSTAVIFVDRLLGFAALFALAIAGALLGGAMVRSLPGLDWLWVGLAGVTLLILVVLVAPGIMAWGLS
ncbi:MAG: lysylphosphatidylglycerol synthase domain-containing protein, partial [Acidobacteriota bacterium]